MIVLLTRWLLAFSGGQTQLERRARVRRRQRDDDLVDRRREDPEGQRQAENDNSE